MADTSIGSAAVLGALEQVLAGRAFQGAGRSGALLRFLIERTLAGQADQLKDTRSALKRSAGEQHSIRGATRSSAWRCRA